MTQHPVVVREAVFDDAEAIATIHVAAWRAAYRELVPAAVLDALSVTERTAQWQEILRAAQTTTLVARTGSEMVGWVSVGASRDADATPRCTELFAIYVHPSWWSRGVGRTLWEHAQSRCDSQADVTLWVLADNARAIRFYEQLGFRRDAEVEETVDIGGSLLAEARFRRSARP